MNRPPSPLSMLFSRHTRRRAFIAALGGAAAWPIAVRAQQSERVRRIGVLMAHKEGDPEFQGYLGASGQGLLKPGGVEGRNVHIDARWGALDDAEPKATLRGTFGATA